MPYKVVVMGNCGVGKSALTIRFLQNRFVAEYEPTARNLYQGEGVVDEVPCELEILDTTGSEAYFHQREEFMRWGQGFLCLYAVDYVRTFIDVSLFWHQLCKVKGTSRVPMVLVANKIDQARWMVNSEMGRDAAFRLNVPFVEASAKTGQGVEQAFQELVREIRKREQNQGHCGFKPCAIL